MQLNEITPDVILESKERYTPLVVGPEAVPELGLPADSTRIDMIAVRRVGVPLIVAMVNLETFNLMYVPTLDEPAEPVDEPTA